MAGECVAHAGHLLACATDSCMPGLVKEGGSFAVWWLTMPCPPLVPMQCRHDGLPGPAGCGVLPRQRCPLLDACTMGSEPRNLATIPQPLSLNRMQMARTSWKHPHCKMHAGLGIKHPKIWHVLLTLSTTLFHFITLLLSFPLFHLFHPATALGSQLLAAVFTVKSSQTACANQTQSDESKPKQLTMSSKVLAEAITSLMLLTKVRDYWFGHTGSKASWGSLNRHAAHPTA